MAKSQTSAPILKERKIVVDVPTYGFGDRLAGNPLIDIIRSVPNNWTTASGAFKAVGNAVKNSSLQIRNTDLGIRTDLYITSYSTWKELSSEGNAHDALNVMFGLKAPEEVDLRINSYRRNAASFELPKLIISTLIKNGYRGEVMLLSDNHETIGNEDTSPESVQIRWDKRLSISARWSVEKGGKKENLWWLVKALTEKKIPFIDGRMYEPGTSDGKEDTLKGKFECPELGRLSKVETLPESKDKNILFVYACSRRFGTLDDLRDFLVDSMFKLQLGIDLRPGAIGITSDSRWVEDFKRQIQLIDELKRRI